MPDAAGRDFIRGRKKQKQMFPAPPTPKEVRDEKIT
jgi:hypothetical protein